MTEGTMPRAVASLYGASEATMTRFDDLIAAVGTLTPAEAQRLATNVDPELFASTVAELRSSDGLARDADVIGDVGARSAEAWPAELVDYLGPDLDSLALTGFRCALAFGPRLSQARRYELSYAWLLVELGRKDRPVDAAPRSLEAAIEAIRTAVHEDVAAFLADRGLLPVRPAIRTSREVLRCAALTIVETHPSLFPRSDDPAAAHDVVWMVRQEALELWFHHFVVTAPPSLQARRREPIRHWVERTIGRPLGPGPAQSRP
jgi:hypothetical protein